MAAKKTTRRAATQFFSGGTLKLNGDVYAPGDEVDGKAVESLPKEERERLLEAGALLEEIAGADEPESDGEGDE